MAPRYWPGGIVGRTCAHRVVPRRLLPRRRGPGWAVTCGLREGSGLSRSPWVAASGTRAAPDDQPWGTTRMAAATGGGSALTIDAASAVLAAFARAVPDGVPVVMVNLLRYRAQTNVAGSEVSGRQAYERYATAVAPIIMAVGGRPLVWASSVRLDRAGAGTLGRGDPGRLPAAERVRAHAAQSRVPGRRRPADSSARGFPLDRRDHSATDQPGRVVARQAVGQLPPTGPAGTRGRLICATN